MSREEKRRLIEPGHEDISITRQCELLGLSRSTLYYEHCKDDAYNDLLRRLIDECYTCTPFYGSRKIRGWLRRRGHEVNRKRVQRLMREMGIEAIYPKPRVSASAKEHRRFPYLLTGLAILEPDQVWCTDITYIRMRKGFIYLVAIMDWYSRYVLSWEVSLTLETEFCIEALERALNGAQPEIFNSDQGTQFTSDEFIARLESREIQVSMDGRGRVYDNIFIERLWRSVKYEEVYIHEYETVRDAIKKLGSYFEFYNHERLHASLGYRTPSEVYLRQKESKGATNNLVSTYPMGQVLVGEPLLA